MSVEDQGHGWSQMLSFDLTEQPMGKSMISSIETGHKETDHF